LSRGGESRAAGWKPDPRASSAGVNGSDEFGGEAWSDLRRLRGKEIEDIPSTRFDRAPNQVSSGEAGDPRYPPRGSPRAPATRSLKGWVSCGVRSAATPTGRRARYRRSG
jgi:hypothetical protein